ncbi:YbaB/EbfC family nucleoid-associated protein, partial [Clostridium saudiense]|nr:YbaB/EbfC family nucleoid-associated protein [Clostridium saudiense]
DGIDLEIFYTVEGDKISKKNASGLYFQTESFKVNGEELFVGGLGSAEYVEESNVYVGSSNYFINSGDMLPTNDKGEMVQVPDEFILTLDISEIQLIESGSIKGSWSFDILVSNEKIKNGVKAIEINEDLSSIEDGLILEDLILTPINTAILGKTSYEGNSS